MAKKKQKKTVRTKRTVFKKPIKKAAKRSNKELDFQAILNAELEKELTKSKKKTIKPAGKIIKAGEIIYNKSEINKLRKMVRKADGTYFSKSYYEKLLKQVKGKKTEEVDEVLIKLRNKNKNVRYFIESTGQVLYFQVGNFIDRLQGEAQTVGVRKGKRKGLVKYTGEVKKGTKLSITDLRGDEHNLTSVIKAMDIIRDQSRIIDKVIQLLRKELEGKLPKNNKKKGIGVYVTILERVKSNSEKEIVSLEYDYSKYEVQGIEKMKFQMLLADVLDE